MVVVLRPGYRIGSRTINRGSRVSNLIVSFRESSNLCILGIIFVGLIGHPCEVLELVVSSMKISSSSKKEFVWDTSCVFGVWRFYEFIFYRDLSSFFILLGWTMMFLCIKL
jgi:hypothetical protein